MKKKTYEVKDLPPEFDVLYHIKHKKELVFTVESTNPMEEGQSVIPITLTMLNVEEQIWRVKGIIQEELFSCPLGGSFIAILNYSTNTGELKINIPEMKDVASSVK